MTATEELRRLLDERGVEWEAFDVFEQTTQWSTYNGAFVYWSRERDGKLLVETTVPTKCSASCTPEQAIAATLGPGTCHLEINTSMTAVVCDRCNYPMPRGTVLTEVHFCPNCGRKVADS